MTELQKLLDRAYSGLSRLNANGEAVIIMAGVMKDLKAAYKLAGPAEKERKRLECSAEAEEADC